MTEPVDHSRANARADADAGDADPDADSAAPAAPVSAPPAAPPDVPDITVAGEPVAASRELAGRLAGLSLPRQVFVLAIWPLFEQFMNFLVGTVDLALASRLEPASLAVQATDALGMAAYVMWLIGVIMSAVGVGAGALVARAIGGRHKRVANAVLGQTILLAIIVGAGVAAAIVAAAPGIGRIAGLEGEELALCVIYLRIIGVVTPAAAVLFEGAACLRAAGDTRSPFWVMVAVNLVNIVFSVAFVYAPAPIGGHGVAGIASGTSVAWIAGGLLILAVLMRRSSPIRLRLHRLRPQVQTLKRIIRVGTPNLLESVGAWGGNFLVLMIVGRLTLKGAVGAHMIAIRIESVSFLTGYALAIAAATLTGQYLGAGQPARARQAVLLCWGAGVALMGCGAIVLLAIPSELVSIISTVPLHLKTVPPLLRLAGCIQIFFATYIVLSEALRGAGDTTTAMWLTYSSMFFVRLPLAYALAVPLGLGLWGLWIGLCGEHIIRAALFAGRFLHGGWMNVRP